MNVVINTCFGGFSISLAAVRWMAAHGSVQAQHDVATFEQHDRWIKAFCATGEWPNDCPQEEAKLLDIYARYYRRNKWYGGSPYERTDPLLVQVVRALGAEANGECADLKVIQIPDGIDYTIEEYDGVECITERHKMWR